MAAAPCDARVNALFCPRLTLSIQHTETKEFF